MKFEEFEKIVNQVLKKLPRKFTDILKKENIPVLVREKAPRVLQRECPGETVFGVFIGHSMKEKISYFFDLEPTRIELYKQSFEEEYGKKVTPVIKEKIAETLIHEIAHYFGFEEDEISSRGL
ncbi:MAG: metallopeptidase family protein [Spirochaetes bacterium]|nr:metallopeptidase family protein [Spirochaetota bacterium]